MSRDRENAVLNWTPAERIEATKAYLRQERPKFMGPHEAARISIEPDPDRPGKFVKVFDLVPWWLDADRFNTTLAKLRDRGGY